MALRGLTIGSLPRAGVGPSPGAPGRRSRTSLRRERCKRMIEQPWRAEAQPFSLQAPPDPGLRRRAGAPSHGPVLPAMYLRVAPSHGDLPANRVAALSPRRRSRPDCTRRRIDGSNRLRSPLPSSPPEGRACAASPSDTRDPGTYAARCPPIRPVQKRLSSVRPGRAPSGDVRQGAARLQGKDTRRPDRPAKAKRRRPGGEPITS